MNEQQAHLAFSDALQCLNRAEPQKALGTLEALASAFPQNPNVHFLLGVTRSMLGDNFAAIKCYDTVLNIQPEFVDAHINRAVDLYSAGDFERSLLSAKRASELDPANPLAWLALGNAQKSLEIYSAALDSYDKAIGINPLNAEAWNNRGDALCAIGNVSGSISSYFKAIEALPNYADAYNNLGLSYYELKQYEQAFAAHNKSIELKPNNPDAYNSLGLIHFDLKQYDQAFTAYNKSIELNPDNPNPYLNLGELFVNLSQYDLSITNLTQSLKLKPSMEWASGALLHTRMKICDWTNFEQSSRELLSQIAESKKAAHPFTILPFCHSRRSQRQCAEIFTSSKPSPISATRPTYNHQKIRLGYVSCDFREHPVTYLIAGVIRDHNRDRFEVFGIDIGTHDEESPSRTELIKTFDGFHEVGHLPDLDVANLIKSLEIDILIDLTGHTKDARSGVFALQPAPVQVSYLGYPGTSGSAYMNYIIGDSTLIPPEAQDSYSEKIAYLPGCFQANDSRRVIEEPKSRADFGFDNDTIIFGCFNQCVKFTPEVFSAWLSILKQVPNSVLWLIEDNTLQVNNLCTFASENGISPNRLVFTGKLPYAEHLARYALMDLALDTMPFNGGTTTSDALWGGAPVLTCIGESFAARMAASLLNAIGLPELVTQSLDEYVNLAIELGTNADKLAAIRHKLAGHRSTTALFNTEQFTRHLENSYEQMVSRHQLGLTPDHIYVPYS